MTCLIRRYIRRSGPRSWSWESTNLSLREDGYEDGYGAASSANQSENQQRGHGVNGTRLNEHGDDGLAQSTTSGSPIAVRTFLARRVSRMTMIGVRQMLSENQIERYGMPAQSCLINSVDW